MRRLSISVLAGLLLCGQALAAGGTAPRDVWVVRVAKKFIRGLTTLPPRLDTAWVQPSALPWSVNLENTLIRTGVDMHSDITQVDAQPGGAVTTRSTLDNSLQKRLYFKLGSVIAYGSARLSYGFEASPKSPGKNTYFSFSNLGPSYGLQVNYYRINEYVDGVLAIEGLSDPFVFPSDEPGQLRTFSVEGFYAFNDSHFAYTAAYVGNVLQRRSAGSWLVSAKYLQGDLVLNQDDAQFLAMTQGLGRYGTQQVSAGAGYSYNWVPFHRQPDDLRTGRGLRNLTLNGTVLPMLAFYNYIRAFTYENGAEKAAVRFNGYPGLVLGVRAGLCFSWDRFYLTARFAYSRYGYHGAKYTTFTDGGRLRTDIGTRGVFYDLSGQALFGVRF